MRFSLSSAESKQGPYAAHLQLFGSPVVPAQLRKITLDNILAGDTCSPIGLSDFEAYLSFVECSLENLQFVVWFQAYRQRFFALPAPLQALSPGAAEADFTFQDSPGPATAHSFNALSTLASDTSTTIEPATPRSPMSATLLAHPLLDEAEERSASRFSRRSSVPTLSLAAASPFGAAPAIPRAQQPLRAECARAVATFLAPGAPKELSLDADTRDGVLRALARNTHPDGLLPVYEAAFHALATGALPRFLVAAPAVTNRPKQLFWTVQGSAWILVGLGVFVAALLAPGAHLAPGGARALRLLASPFVALGCMMLWTARRGFCIKVAGRSRVQLRAWELEHADEGTHAWWAKLSGEPTAAALHGDDELSSSDVEAEKLSDAEEGAVSQSSGSLPAALASLAARRARRRREKMLADLAAIAPFADLEAAAAELDAGRTPAPLGRLQKRRSDNALAPRPPPVAITFTRMTTVTEPIVVGPPQCDEGDGKDRPPTPSDAGESSIAQMDAGRGRESHALPSFGMRGTSTSRSMGSRRSGSTSRRRRSSRNGYHAPPVFGPEKVVLDPRILAIHKKVSLELKLTGVIAFFLSAVVFLAMPIVHLHT